MRSVRLTFTKIDTAKYISHLDLTRCLIRAFRRTDIPLWYTEGFNPHPHLVFGMPLPLGVEGEREILDIRINDDEYKNSRILENMRRASVPGIDFISVSEPVYKTPEITFGDYEITIPCENPRDTAEKIKAICRGPVYIEKKTKKKEIKTINVTEYIKQLDVNCADGGVVIKCILPAGNDFTVNPVPFTAELLNKLDMPNALHNIVRKKLLLKDCSEFK